MKKFVILLLSVVLVIGLIVCVNTHSSEYQQGIESFKDAHDYSIAALEYAQQRKASMEQGDMEKADNLTTKTQEAIKQAKNLTGKGIYQMKFIEDVDEAELYEQKLEEAVEEYEDIYQEIEAIW